MTTIKKIIASEVLNSRGYGGIETTVILSNEITASSSPPSGTSKGAYEAHEIIDIGSKRYNGHGVLKAVENVNKIIAPILLGIDIGNQQKIDELMIELDATKDKSRLGANAILSVSQAAAKAAAKNSSLPLYLYLKRFIPSNTSKKYPTPLFVMLAGGKHADNSMDLQEILLIPSIAKPFEEKIEIGVNIYHLLEQKLLELDLSTLTSIEGGFSPKVSNNIEALELMRKVINNSGYKLSLDVSLGIDAASTSFYKEKQYFLKDKKTSYAPDELTEFYQTLTSDFNIIYLEDPFSEDDWSSWQKGFDRLSKNSLVVGDDLTVTNPNRLKIAISKNAINGIIIKPNQIGTISESLDVVKIARSNNLKVIVSHRSAETMDDFIADFAIGVSADYVKFGAPARERVIKYNRLLKIKRELDQSR
ncbi:MAG: phosphopyruvate hydratase [Patescibacteria group bacterium]